MKFFSQIIIVHTTTNKHYESTSKQVNVKVLVNVLVNVQVNVLLNFEKEIKKR